MMTYQIIKGRFIINYCELRSIAFLLRFVDEIAVFV